MLKLPQNLTTLLLGVLIINVIGLWTVYFISQPAQINDSPSKTTQDNFLTTSMASDSASEPDSANEPDLVATQTDKITELKNQLDEISEVVATLSAQSPIITQTISQPASNNAKEYVIYLGSGNTTSRDWVEILGTKTTVDAANYPVIKELEFQASLKIIGGEARARLKNITTGAVFYDSEVMHNSSITTWVSRSNLLLTGGSNEYVVELRSTSGELAQLEGARLRIMVE